MDSFTIGSRMTIRHLQIFLALSKELNMTRTAEKLFMTQPSVSQTIAELERHYQVKLFDRLGKKLFLTTAGTQLITRAQDLLKLLEDTEMSFRAATQQRLVRIGASATVGSYLLPNILNCLHKQDPDLQIEFLVANTSQVEASLLHAELDLGVVEGKTVSRNLRSVPVFKDRLVLVGIAKFLPNKRSYAAKELESVPFLLRETGSGTAEQAQMALSNWGIQPRIAGIANSIDALHRLVRAGVGVAFLPWLAVEDDLAKGKLAEFQLHGARMDRSIRMIYHTGKRMETDLHTVMECIKSVHGLDRHK